MDFLLRTQHSEPLSWQTCLNLGIYLKISEWQMDSNVSLSVLQHVSGGWKGQKRGSMDCLGRNTSCLIGVGCGCQCGGRAQAGAILTWIIKRKVLHFFRLFLQNGWYKQTIKMNYWGGTSKTNKHVMLPRALNIIKLIIKNKWYSQHQTKPLHAQGVCICCETLSSDNEKAAEQIRQRFVKKWCKHCRRLGY